MSVCFGSYSGVAWLPLQIIYTKYFKHHRASSIDGYRLLIVNISKHTLICVVNLDHWLPTSTSPSTLPHSVALHFFLSSFRALFWFQSPQSYCIIQSQTALAKTLILKCQWSQMKWFMAADWKRLFLNFPKEGFTESNSLAGYNKEIFTTGGEICGILKRTRRVCNMVTTLSTELLSPNIIYT